MKESKADEVRVDLLDWIIESLATHRGQELDRLEADPTSEPFRKGLRLGTDYTDLHTLEWLRNLRSDFSA